MVYSPTHQLISTMDGTFLQLKKTWYFGWWTLNTWWIHPFFHNGWLMKNLGIVCRRGAAELVRNIGAFWSCTSFLAELFHVGFSQSSGSPSHTPSHGSRWLVFFKTHDIIDGRSSGSNTWRYVSTICLAKFWGDIPWNFALKNRPYIW